MKVSNTADILSRPVDMEGAKGCTIRWLVTAEDGAPTFAMRHFEVSAGGHTPRHSHPYEHEVYILEGTGSVTEGDDEHAIAAGDVIFVAPDEIHQFRNAGPEPLKFLCLIPNSAAGKPVKSC